MTTRVLIAAVAVAALAAPQVRVPPIAAVVPGPGLVASLGDLRINPAAVRTYLPGSQSFATVTISPSGGCAPFDIPVSGAMVGDRVVLGPPTELLTYSLAMTYAVYAPGIVRVRLCNYTVTAIRVPAWTWNVDVVTGF